MSRRNLLVWTLSLLLGCEPVLKESPAPASYTGSTSESASLVPSPCRGCVVGPVTVTVGDNQVPQVVQFEADTDADYLLVVQDDGQEHTGVGVRLNERTVLEPGDLEGRQLKEVSRALSVREQNRLVIIPTGPRGAKITLWVIGGAELIGPAGGVIVAPQTGATVTVPPGAITDPILVQLTVDSAHSALYVPLSTTAHSLTFSLSSTSAAFDPTAAIIVTLPLDATRVLPDSASISAFVKEIPGETFWVEAPIYGAATAIAIPAHGLSQISSVLNSTSTTISLLPEQVIDPTAPPAPIVTQGQAVNCTSYPTGLPAPWPSPGPLRQDPRSSTSSTTALVLVHGWDRKILTCPNFSSKASSGETYFSQLLPVLESAFGTRVQIWVYTYPTFNDFKDSGYDLASRLAGANGINRVVFLGHSMGGLVAREATQQLNTAFTRPGLVQGIVTLGTPHLGALKAALFNTFLFFKATPGSASLVAGITRTTQEAPIIAYAGRLPSCLGSWDLIYALGCQLLPPPLNLVANDGIVATFSAAPAFAAKGTVWDYYDHHEVLAGQNGQGSMSDPLYASIITDLNTLLLVGAFREDFNGTSLPSGWLPTGGSWSVASGILTGSFSTIGVDPQLVKTLPFNPAMIRARILNTPGAPLGAAGMTFNWASTSDYYSIELRTGNPAVSADIVRRGVGGVVSLASCPTGLVATNTWYVLELQDGGSGLTGLVLDGQASQVLCTMQIGGSHLTNATIGFNAYSGGGLVDVDWVEAD